MDFDPGWISSKDVATFFGSILLSIGLKLRLTIISNILDYQSILWSHLAILRSGVRTVLLLEMDETGAGVEAVKQNAGCIGKTKFQHPVPQNSMAILLNSNNLQLFMQLKVYWNLESKK